MLAVPWPGIVEVGPEKNQPNANGYAEKWVDTPV